MLVNVERVAVITRGLLDVDAIGEQLRTALGEEHAGADTLPLGRVSKLGEERSRIEQAERFAGQMCVRREVVGQVPLDVIGMLADAYQNEPDILPEAR